ncbi:Tyrosine recombinase XerC [Paraburkholderia aspalathi]|uniref:Tyrosine recombinase XerC n=1 Tax=Paraburkholderia aspalathi TaxID=1324617 RepID=A0ABN7NDW4_9BURK|nr:site-specific integrase [Paraburkholderia aspalathi]MBK3824283.1 site-specific integrase [Paraburkholderia aspalathi]MBK3836130.1 site-specific integrase [Paraburkholderia aspalathi]MBK3865898.1 site-specific integrase [Paraburkholderia aspalathi]CAE6869706.1 Tyrosine recombinase XerC [Paraburkholderia aspalathi]
MASIIPRGTNWQVKIRTQGQPIRSKTFPTKEAAEAWAASQVKVKPKAATKPRKPVLTVADLFERYIKTATPHRRSGEWERRVLQRMVRTEKTLCALPAAKLGKPQLAEWRDRRVTEVLGSTVGRELDAISSVYRLAIEEWDLGLTVNPVRGFRRPKLPLPRDIRLAIGDDEKLIAAAIEFNREIAPAVVLAIETAMRQGEIAKLRWEHIDVEARTAFLPITKNGTARKVPLSSKAIEALTWCPPPHRGRVFKLTQSAMQHAFRQIRQQCGLGNVHFHDLRHEAASRLFEKGLNVMEVAAITGHKNLKMLQRYTHLRAEDLAKKLG